MSRSNGFLALLGDVARRVLSALSSSSSSSPAPRASDQRERAVLRPTRTPAAQPHSLGTETVEVHPPHASELRITYSPQRDGAPDAGEVVWTWVPYAENDGRGKDRPVLVIAKASHDRVYAVKLTSKAKDGDRDFLSIGSGPWDQQGRPSWVDIDQVYSVHVDGLRREAAPLDLTRFARVAQALQTRYGWAAGN